jgi:hypothetical protein
VVRIHRQAEQYPWRVAALSPDGRVSVAEQTMERAGHAGRSFHVPTARRQAAYWETGNDDNLAYDGHGPQPVGGPPLLGKEWPATIHQMPTELVGRYRLDQDEEDPDYPPGFDPDPELLDHIRQYGIQRPLEIGTNGTRAALLEGNHRWRAALDLGLPTVPVAIFHNPELHNPEWAIHDYDPEVDDDLRPYLGQTRTSSRHQGVTPYKWNQIWQDLGIQSKGYAGEHSYVAPRARVVRKINAAARTAMPYDFTAPAGAQRIAAPRLTPDHPDFWGNGGCAAMALAYKNLFPHLKLGTEWDRPPGGSGDHLNHVWVYDDQTGSSHDWRGAHQGRDGAAPRFTHGQIELDVDPALVAQSMGHDWSPDDPWADELVGQAEEHLRPDPNWQYGRQAHHTAAARPGSTGRWPRGIRAAERA